MLESCLQLVTCVFVWLKFEGTFSMCLSLALKRLSLEQTHSSPTPKVFVLYLEGDLEPSPLNKNRNQGKSFCKNSFHLRMGLKKYKYKAEMKDCKKTTLQLLCIFANVRQCSCILSFLLVSVLFSGPSLSKMKFYRNVLPRYIYN